MDIEKLRQIDNAADFYAWKPRIVLALQGKYPEYARKLSLNKNILDVFMKKEEILEKLEGE